VESITDVAPWFRSSFSLDGGTDDVHQRHAVGLADPHQHLAEVGGGRGVDHGPMAFGPHRLDHAERR
jgi:hypothetical protein